MRTMKDKTAFLILRFSLGAVFILFGIGKLQGDVWAQTIKSMAVFQDLPWSVDHTVMFIGLMEILTGAGLIAGLRTRFFAVLAAIQLTAILFLLNFQETRDIGLWGAAVFMALVKEDFLSLDRWISKKEV